MPLCLDNPIPHPNSKEEYPPITLWIERVSTTILGCGLPEEKSIGITVASGMAVAIIGYISLGTAVVTNPTPDR